jgi:hypothetical protein
LRHVAAEQDEIRCHVEQVRKIADTLDPITGDSDKRKRRFMSLQKSLVQSDDPASVHMAKVMNSFLPGLFVGDDDPDLPHDNLDLERWFRKPKSHERRIHGHRHAGVRIVQEGPTLLPVLDAHSKHPTVFTVEELFPYINAKPPECQTNAIQRRSIMRKACSTKKLPDLLSTLEVRYIDSS